MKKSKYITFSVFAVLAFSIFINYCLYYEANKPRIYGGSTPTFISYENNILVKASGYLQWNDISKQPATFRQFWLVSIKNQNCYILDIWEMKSGIIPNWTSHTDGISNCNVVKLELNTALIEYKDSIISITKSGVSVITKDKEEAGGARLSDAISFYKL